MKITVQFDTEWIFAGEGENAAAPKRFYERMRSIFGNDVRHAGQTIDSITLLLPGLRNCEIMEMRTRAILTQCFGKDAVDTVCRFSVEADGAEASAKEIAVPKHLQAYFHVPVLHPSGAAASDAPADENKPATAPVACSAEVHLPISISRIKPALRMAPESRFSCRKN